MIIIIIIIKVSFDNSFIINTQTVSQVFLSLFLMKNEIKLTRWRNQTNQTLHQLKNVF
jgi:hypothetical protein